MADNPNIELAEAIMIERYGLDEQKYRLESFSESSKGDVSLRMSDGWIPVSVKFPADFLEYEKVLRMTQDEKRERFHYFLPSWNKLPMEFRELFADIADNWDDPDELPTLREGRVAVTETPTGVEITVKPVKAAVKPSTGAKKTLAKKPKGA